MKPVSIGIEITNQCNLRCPICARRYMPPKKKLFLTPKQFEGIKINEVESIKRVNIIGSRGDPLRNPFIIPIIKLTKDWDKQVTLSTNGNFYTEVWWRTLPKYLPKDHFIVFALDGVDNDSLKYYRKGSSYKRVIDNARAFISSGGRAIWQFIMFKHNEHLLDEAKNIAGYLGFHDVLVIASTKYTKKYQRPSSGILSNIEYSDDKRQDNKCCRLHYNKVNVSAKGEYLPCCLVFTEPQVLNVMGDEPIKYIDDYSLPEVLADGYYERILERVETTDIPDCRDCNVYCGIRTL